MCKIIILGLTFIFTFICNLLSIKAIIFWNHQVLQSQTSPRLQSPDWEPTQKENIIQKISLKCKGQCSFQLFGHFLISLIDFLLNENVDRKVSPFQKSIFKANIRIITLRERLRWQLKWQHIRQQIEKSRVFSDILLFIWRVSLKQVFQGVSLYDDSGEI